MCRIVAVAAAVARRSVCTNFRLDLALFALWHWRIAANGGRHTLIFVAAYCKAILAIVFRSQFRRRCPPPSPSLFHLLRGYNWICCRGCDNKAKAEICICNSNWTLIYNVYTVHAVHAVQTVPRGTEVVGQIQSRIESSQSAGSAQLSIKKSNSNCQSCAICLRAIETKSECDTGSPRECDQLDNLKQCLGFTVHILRIRRVCRLAIKRENSLQSYERKARECRSTIDRGMRWQFSVTTTSWTILASFNPLQLKNWLEVE